MLCTSSLNHRPQARLQACRSPVLTSLHSLRGTALTVPRPGATLAQRSGLVIEAKQNSKKRQRVALKSRLYNKARKSACATRLKKVFTALGGFQKVQSEEELQPVQPLINAAYEELDKAVQKGILHANTVARRKSRIAVTRQKILISSGLYTPASS